MEHTPTAADLVRDIMRRTGLKQHQVAERLGVTQPTVSRWLKGATPDATQYHAIERIYAELDLPFVKQAFASRLVPLVGYVGAGWSIVMHEYDQISVEYVRAPIDATENTVAVKIRGTSLGAMFDGWLVYYDDVHSPITDDMMKKLCVVGVDIDGGEAILIKHIEKGGKPGTFNLYSNDPPIYDAVVNWGAVVLWMGRP